MARRSLRSLARPTAQASLDYVAILALAALVLTAGTGVAMARGGDLASAVRSHMARALCVVTAGDCARDLAPCVVRTRQDSFGAHLNVLVVKVGKDHVAVLDERSDGTFAVSLVSTWNAGLEGGLGLEAKVSLAGRSLALGGEFRAAALAHEGRGKTWIVRSRAQAEALVDRIRGVRAAISAPDLPEPAFRYYEHGTSVTFGAHGALADRAKAALTLRAKDLDGARSDRHNGHEMHYLKRSNALDGVLGISARRGGAGEGGVLAGGDHVWAFERDRAGRPRDLMILSSGEYRGSFSLPPLLREVAGYLGAPARGIRRYEVETHLDLTDPDNLAAAQAYLRAVLDGGPRPFRERAAVSDELATRLRTRGIVHARTYAVDSRSTGASLHAGAGGKIGGGAEHVTRTARLLAATTRGQDGTWQLRTECATTS
jgi:hypothetical protein